MERCRKLGEYAYFIHSIREKQNHGMSLDQAVNDAIDDCIREHILESILVKQRAEVKNVVLSTFNQENHDRILKEAHEKIGEERGIAIGQKKGVAIGRKKGIAIGQDMVLKDIVSKKLTKNKSIKQICDELEQDEKTILSIIEKIKQ